MIRLFVTIGMMALLAGPVAAQEEAIESVIAQQFEAFGDADTERAFTFASPMIQTMFGTPEQFGEMVRRGFPMIWDHDGTRFLGLRTENGRWVERLIVTARDGSLHVFDYEMIEGWDGWRINGVTPVRNGDTGA